MTWKFFSQALKGLLLPATLAVIFGVTAYALDRFDRGYGGVRAVCLLGLGVVVFVLQYVRVRAVKTARTDLHVLWLSVAILAILGATSIPDCLVDLPHRPRCDVGWTTSDAVHVLVNDLENPYRSTWIGKLGPDEKYWGYHYGPGTVLAYLPAEAFGPGGVKVMNLLYLALAFCLIAALLCRTEGLKSAIGPVAFAIMLVSLPSRVWSETFRQGATDILPAMLVLAGLVAIHDRRLFLAGVLAGFSVSCKIMPGFPFVLLLVRWPLNFRLLAGVLTGLVPIGLAALWDCAALANNSILFHGGKQPDDTSLYSVLPASVTWLFPLLQVALACAFWFRNWRREYEVQDLATQVFLLTVLVEVLYKEIHGNHLLWFFPLGALLFCWGWRRAMLTGTEYERVS